MHFVQYFEYIVFEKNKKFLSAYLTVTFKFFLYVNNLSDDNIISTLNHDLYWHDKNACKTHTSGLAFKLKDLLK